MNALDKLAVGRNFENVKPDDCNQDVADPEEAHRWACVHFLEAHQPIAEIVGRILVQQTGMPWAELSPSSRFFEEINVWDDFDAGRYADAVEHQFGISISEDDRARIHRILDLVEYLHAAMSK